MNVSSGKPAPSNYTEEPTTSLWVCNQKPGIFKCRKFCPGPQTQQLWTGESSREERTMVSVGRSVLGSLCMDAGLSLGVTHGLEGTLVEKHAGTMA